MLALRQSLAPQLEVLEAAWARLHTLTGAESPEDAIAFWQGKLQL